MNPEYLEKFKEQKNNIEFYTIILCQERSEVPKVLEWVKTQRDIPYLPREDIFAYYCPICNSIIKLKENCSLCEQNINWEFQNHIKLIDPI